MRTYKYPIRNHPKNKRLGNLRDELANVYNHFLRLEKRYYRRYGRYAGRLRLQPHLTKLLKRSWVPIGSAADSPMHTDMSLGAVCVDTACRPFQTQHRKGKDDRSGSPTRYMRRNADRSRSLLACS